MTYWWNELVARLGDVVPGGVPVLGLALFLLTGLIAALWYWWPAWVPRRWPRFRLRRRARRNRRGWRNRLGRLRFRWRLRWRRRKKTTDPVELPHDELPDLPAAVLELNADQLAAAGRYKEAVRERLRAMVRDLVERSVLAAVPGWTVTELALAGGHNRPAIAPALRCASELFSEIWYGFRPATAADDDAMRGWAEQVRTTLDADPASARPAEVVAR